MENASSRYFPAIAARIPRGTTQIRLSAPNGLIYKNKLFWVDGTKCFYDGQEVAGLTVSDGKKQLVGMGAYICIFPDKVIYNTATGEIKRIDAEHTPSGAVTFKEFSPDSVFCKISAPGLGQAFALHDGVKIDGVDDKAFTIDGAGVTKVITDIGDDYIVVTASIQTSFTGGATLTPDSGRIRIAAEGIGETFTASDTVKLLGCLDEALNVKDVTVSPDGSDAVLIDAAMPAKSYAQSVAVTFAAYYAGSDRTKITGSDLNTLFTKGDIVTISGCTNAFYNRSFEILQAGTDYIIIDGTLNSAFTQASGLRIVRTGARYDGITLKRTAFSAENVTFSRKSQDFDFVCEHNNRLWACNSENHEIYASKLGDPTNWNCFEGISTDSYALTVGSDGPFTGCIAHEGHVLFFKEGTIHMMYGDKPSNFALNTADLPGVREGCFDSLEIVNETLYYVGRNGIYAYNGAIPQKISDNIIDEISDAVSTQEDGRLYVSCKMAGKQTILCYDPRLRIWNKENDEVFRYAYYGEGKGYYVDAEGKIKTVTGDDFEIIDWFVESGNIKEDIIFDKYISKLMFNLWLRQGTTATIFIKCDDSPLWVRKGTITSDKDTVYTLPIVPQRCNKYRYRIEFHGDGKLISSGRYVEGGTELNGSVHHGYRRT